uniref:Uncharacterized protein n=1 Tax=Megaselia scalaris TaxID=36166 RepID=T1GJI0_MEGSC
MITQAKRRTNVKQKLEESLRKEIARRSEDEGENKEVPPPEFEKDFEMVDMKKEEAPQEQPKPESVNIALQEPNYYMLPRIVDTIYVTGDIKEISSGLYHFALISTSGTLYTWGKNLEYQLGNGDGERKSISFPQIVEGITNPIHVECGADFTLVMMDDLTMKSFGGNANGQCAVPLTNTQETKSGRLFCLPTTKRLLRLEGKCVITPTEVNLPRPRINLDNEPIRHLKSLPKFKNTLSTLPMKKHHIKYCIYYLLQHFLDKKFEFSDCEQYFMNDLDYYLLELSFVLYLSNNNNFEFEQFFDEKFNNTNNILMDDANIQQDIFQLNYIDMIFENLTVKFKTVFT